MSRVDEPRTGMFKVRLTKGGPWVAMKISHGPALDPITGETLDRSPLWSVEINGEIVGTPCPDPWGAGVDPTRMGDEIDEAEYRYLIALKDHAERYEPDHPAARPRRAIDPNSTRPIF